MSPGNSKVKSSDNVCSATPSSMWFSPLLLMKNPRRLGSLQGGGGGWLIEPMVLAVETSLQLELSASAGPNSLQLMIRNVIPPRSLW